MEHKQIIRSRPRISTRDVDLIHNKEFMKWFERRVSIFLIKSIVLYYEYIEFNHIIAL